MSLVASLLQAIVHVDGDALVIHAGDKPYVVAPTGQVELATRCLTLEAAGGIVNQLLPSEFQKALDDFGAVQYELPSQSEFPNEHFTVVAARGGDDVWAEIRRRRIPDEDQIPDDVFGAPQVAPEYVDAAVRTNDEAAGRVPLEVESEQLTAVEKVPEEQAAEDGHLQLPNAHQLWPDAEANPVLADARAESDPAPADMSAEDDMPTAEPEEFAEEEFGGEEVEIELDAPDQLPEPEAEFVEPEPVSPVSPQSVVQPAAQPVVPPVASQPPKPPPATPQQPVQPVARTVPTSHPAVVLPISRNPIRMEAPPPTPAGDTLSGLERLLRLAAARGASTLYLSAGERPSVRVDGEIQMIDGEPVLSSHDVVSLLLTLMPDRSHEALRTGAPTEWISDIEDVGRVRCVSFGDHRGPGGVFRLMPARVASVEQLGLSKHVQRLAIEPEGLVLAVGSRSSGKRTLIASLVDLINRTRRDHVITIEREVSIVQPRGTSFISQREVRGGDDEQLTAARAALREDPDVLVLEQIRNGAMMNVALEAAASGHLVIGGFSAHNVTAAVDRIIDLYAPEYSRQVQLALADNLRGVVAQVLLKKNSGGRIPAREVLLNTPAVSAVIAEGKTSQLPMAIEGGRRHGMMPLNEAIAALVQSGEVEAMEAYRHVADRSAFLSLLRRQGLDTSFAERFA